MPSEDQPLLSTGAIGAAAASGAGLINTGAQKIQEARRDGPLTFRMLGFLGGLAMIISNGLAIMERFFSFNFARALIAIYGVFFGIIITLMDAPMPVMCSSRFQNGLR